MISDKVLPRGAINIKVDFLLQVVCIVLKLLQSQISYKTRS